MTLYIQPLADPTSFSKMPAIPLTYVPIAFFELTSVTPPAEAARSVTASTVSPEWMVTVLVDKITPDDGTQEATDCESPLRPTKVSQRIETVQVLADWEDPPVLPEEADELPLWEEEDDEPEEAADCPEEELPVLLLLSLSFFELSDVVEVSSEFLLDETFSSELSPLFEVFSFVL